MHAKKNTPSFSPKGIKDPTSTHLHHIPNIPKCQQSPTSPIKISDARLHLRIKRPNLSSLFPVIYFPNTRIGTFEKWLREKSPIGAILVQCIHPCQCTTETRDISVVRWFQFWEIVCEVVAHGTRRMWIFCDGVGGLGCVYFGLGWSDG